MELGQPFIELDDLPAFEGERVVGTSIKFTGKATQRTRPLHEDDEVMFLVIGKVAPIAFEREKRKGLVRAHKIAVTEAYPADGLVDGDALADLRLAHKRALDALAGDLSTDDLEADLLAEEQRLAAEESLANAGAMIDPSGVIVTPSEVAEVVALPPYEIIDVDEEEEGAAAESSFVDELVPDANPPAPLEVDTTAQWDLERGEALEAMRVHATHRDGYYTDEELAVFASGAVSVTQIVEMYRAAERRVALALAGR